VEAMKSLEWLQKVAESLGGFRYPRTSIFNLDEALVLWPRSDNYLVKECPNSSN